MSGVLPPDPYHDAVAMKTESHRAEPRGSIPGQSRATMAFERPDHSQARLTDDTKRKANQGTRDTNQKISFIDKSPKYSLRSLTATSEDVLDVYGGHDDVRLRRQRSRQLALPAPPARRDSRTRAPPPRRYWLVRSCTVARATLAP